MDKKNLKQKRGKFIVLYGANNLGKSEQLRQLSRRFLKDRHDVLSVKYPLYQLDPTGPRINNILRDPNSKERGIDELEFQKIYAQNRRDFQQQLIQLLESNIHVLAEDYVGTSLAWGMTNGANYEDLYKINSDLLEPDIALLLDGERFHAGKEVGHRNEDKGNEIWNNNRNIHLDLAKKHSWNLVNANQSIEEVHEDIWKIVEPILAI